MNDILHKKVVELVNRYNTELYEHGFEVTLNHRIYTEDVEPYNAYGQYSLLNLLEYILIRKRIENKKYHHIPNRYKLLILQVQPINKSLPNKADYKKYAFWEYQLWRTHQGEKPIEWKYKEQSVVAKVEKKLKRLLKRAKKSTSSNWCNNTLWDALRYSFSRKYGYLGYYCGKSSDFWEIFWIFVFGLPFLLFAIVGLLCSFIY